MRGSPLARFDIVHDLAPRAAARWIGEVEGEAAVEFRALGVGELDVALRQAIPEVLRELNPLFGGQVTEVKDGRGHSRKLGELLVRGKRLSRHKRLGSTGPLAAP